MYRGAFQQRIGHSTVIVNQPVDGSDFSFSLFMHSPQYVLFECLPERHHSCQHSESLPLLRPLTENQPCSLNVPLEMERQAFPPVCYIHVGQHSLVSMTWLDSRFRFSRASGKSSALSCGAILRRSNCIQRLRLN